MSVYADASLLVAAFTPEAKREVAVRWLTGLGSEELLTSKWCETKVASALALKERTGHLAADGQQPAFAIITRLLRAKARIIAIEGDHFDRATDFLRRSIKALRGGDALHLAIAAGAGATVWTLDRRMAAAGEALGLDVRLVA